MLSKKLQVAIEAHLTEKTHGKTRIKQVSSITGGCINQAYRVKTNAGDFFVKYNHAQRFPGMFEAEAKGLKELKKSSTLCVPEVIATGEAGEEAFLLLEFIENGSPKKDYWEEAGTLLAKMHRQSVASFGLDHDNYIGSLAQSNRQHNDWAAFFIEERLETQCRMACDSGAIDSATLRLFDRLYPKVENLFPEEPPSLLHGDLWSGNIMCGPQGQPCIMDPAVYYGHREMDIAMTKLFGGFEPAFYRSYLQEYPLEKDWQSRMDIANLYPLMVHVNLFGGSYLDQVRAILKRLV